MSESDALDDLMCRVLTRLTLVSDGKASSPGMSSAAGDNAGSATIAHSKGVSQPILRLGRQDWGWEIRSLTNRYNRTTSDAIKRTLIAEALRGLVRAKYAPDQDLRRGTREWRERIAKDPRSATKVAVVFDVGRRSVYVYRKEFGVTSGQRAA